jgi:hypothetical protein
VDALYGYIPGFYLGLDPPSAQTVKLAFLHALTPKGQWLDDLGLDIPEEDWVPMTFGTAIADNTDLRCAEVRDALLTIGTNLLHVPVARSDCNSIVESGHHSMHRLVDHNLEGTTYGKRTERGEIRADIRARHTILEGIRETARAIHTHNTMQLDISLPLAMREAGIKPTRLAMTQWSINQGKVARACLDIESARARLMPRCRGTVTESGIKLLRPDTGDKRVFIEPLRYVSDHSYILAQMALARRGGKQTRNYFDGDYLIDPFNVRSIYFLGPDDLGLIPLDLKIRDSDLPDQATLADVLEIMDQDKVTSHFTKEEKEVALNRLESAQEDVKEAAKAEYNDELSKLGKPPSKASLCGEKRKNREDERETYHGMQPLLIPNDEQDEEQTNPPRDEPEARIEKKRPPSEIVENPIAAAIKKRRQTGY